MSKRKTGSKGKNNPGKADAKGDDAAAGGGKGGLHDTMEDALAQFGGQILTGPRFKAVVDTATATAKALGAK